MEQKPDCREFNGEREGKNRLQSVLLKREQRNEWSLDEEMLPRKVVLI